MSNQTTLVCDVLPVWKGYIWGAQGGATFDICSLFLVTVPPFLAFYFGILYLLTTLEGKNNILERFDAKVESFNARVERIILALKRKDYPGQLVAALPDLPDLSEVPSCQLGECPSSRSCQLVECPKLALLSPCGVPQLALMSPG